MRLTSHLARHLRLALAIGPGLLLAAPAAAATSPPVQPNPGPLAGAVRVSMKDFAFAPASITIHAGQAVAWTYDESPTDPAPNCESIPLQLPGSPVRCPGHSTTADTAAGGAPLWDSGVKRADGFPYSVRFLSPGTYAYHCTVHGGMTANNPVTHMNGTVVVLAAAPATAAPTAPAAPAAPTPPGSPAATRALPATGTVPDRPIGLALLLAGAVLTLFRRVRPH